MQPYKKEPVATNNGLSTDGISGKNQYKNTHYAGHSQPTPEHCRKLLQYIPQRPDYKTWIECIAAVGNTFSEITALDLLRSRFTDERKNEHAQLVFSSLQGIARRVEIIDLLDLMPDLPAKGDVTDYLEKGGKL